MAMTQNHYYFHFSMMSMLAANHNALKPFPLFKISTADPKVAVCHNCCPCDPPNQ
jgi:hypothetical protein